MDLTTLPFDQYGRYRIVADAIGAARQAIGRPLTLLDVGGYFRSRRGVELLPARAFLPDEDVTVLDQPACDLPGYRQGDGRRLAFDADSFDFVISCDVLEHVPAADREAFWLELLRVARYGVLLIAPMRSPETQAAERLVEQFILAELGQRQPQLLEHRAYGLPEPAKIQALLDSRGLRARSIPASDLHAWVAMMIARHMRPLCDDEEFGEQLDSYYTRFLSDGDRRGVPYRQLWVAEKRAEAGWFDAIPPALGVGPGAAAEPMAWERLQHWQIQAVALRRRAEGGALQQRAEVLARERDTQAERVATLERRAAHLEQQIAGARETLAAAERGRPLRLLRWLRSRGRGATE